MAKQDIVLVLTRVELDHLLTLLLNERDDGTYWGRRDQHQQRQARLIEILEREP